MQVGARIRDLLRVDLMLVLACRADISMPQNSLDRQIINSKLVQISLYSPHLRAVPSKAFKLPITSILAIIGGAGLCIRQREPEGTSLP